MTHGYASTQRPTLEGGIPFPIMLSVTVNATLKSKLKIPMKRPARPWRCSALVLRPKSY